VVRLETEEDHLQIRFADLSSTVTFALSQSTTITDVLIKKIRATDLFSLLPSAK
jgi:hypothetical protein